MKTVAPPKPCNGINIDLDALIALRDEAQSLLWRSPRSARAHRQGSQGSRQQGRGIDFAETRMYQAGDDIRHIDWHATLRTQHTHTKLFHEEKERPIWLLVDHNPSMYFATRKAFKSVIAARAAALCAWAFSAAGERVGGMVFSGQQHFCIPPKDRLHALLPFLKQLADSSQKPAAAKNAKSLSIALDQLLRRNPHGGLILIFSDFWQGPSDLTRSLRALAQKNTCIAICIHDPLEYALPEAGYYAVSDGTDTETLNCYHRELKQQYQSQAEQRQQHLHKTLQSLNIQTLEISTQDDLIQSLKTIFI